MKCYNSIIELNQRDQRKFICTNRSELRTEKRKEHQADKSACTVALSGWGKGTGCKTKQVGESQTFSYKFSLS